MRLDRLGIVCALSATLVQTALAQTATSQALSLQTTSWPALGPLASPAGGLAIRRHVAAGQPFTVAGTRGVILGQQEGTFEAWVLPVKLLSHFAIRAEVEGYSVPIDLNAAAAEIEVFPDRTTITYSHIAFTVRQTMFAPDEAPDGTGAVVVFEIDASRPMDLTFSFTPDMRPMWPKLSQGTASPEWIAKPGMYLLHTDFDNLAGAITIPGSQPGILAPYQEKPQVHPLELKLHFDPKRDAGKAFPLLMAVGQTSETATNAALEARLNSLNQALPQLYRAHQARYTQMQHDLTAIVTPDKAFNDAFTWAEISIEQLRARSQPEGETGLVAGYYSSGDSARPGFGWYFGRDTLYTLYAVNGMGDFKLSREAMEFLIRRQRADGKMMHEYSQTAAFVDWKSLPYMYAAADATPLFLTAMLDYVQTSGDLEFLRAHREAVAKAWAFETSHDADSDGIYDNAQGTGWVESWPGGQPKQEIYLALLDQQASAAMAKLSGLLGDSASAASAEKRAEAIAATIEREYYVAAMKKYAFSKNPDGSLDKAETIYPALAWWNGGKGLEHAEESFRAWDSHDFSTDWGARDVSASDPVYDPISYHQGSVWPLFTGWIAMADYRSGRAISGYSHLMENANQTTTQDLGAVTELLSGDFFQPFGRSTSHQLWSSAMVITPTLRGLFGVEIDALSRFVTVNPNLPADWKGAEIQSLHVGDSVCDLIFEREAGGLRVRLKGVSGPAVGVRSGVSGARSGADGVLIPLPGVEVAVPHELPLPGARTAQMKVLAEIVGAHSVTLELEGQGGSTVELGLRQNRPGLVRASGGAIEGIRSDGLAKVVVRFGPGAGYQRQTMVFTW